MKRSLEVCSFVVAALAAFAWASQSVAQPPQRGGFGGPGGPGGGGILGLAMRDDVQQELQLVDEQKDKVRDIVDGARDTIRNKFGDDFRALFSQSGDLTDEQRRAKFEELRTKVDAEMEKDLSNVLLPHQMERLKQIDLQTKIRQRGASALTGGDIAKALNLTDEQREKLEKRAAEVQEELQTKIRQLQLEARDKMLDVLTPDQQAQLKKLMGDQMDLKDQPFGGPGGFRGGFNRGGGPNGQGRGGRPPSDSNQTK